MKDFKFIAQLAQNAQRGDTAAQLKIAEQIRKLINSTITELKVKEKKGK